MNVLDLSAKYVLKVKGYETIIIQNKYLMSLEDNPLDSSKPQPLPTASLDCQPHDLAALKVSTQTKKQEACLRLKAFLYLLP